MVIHEKQLSSPENKNQWQYMKRGLEDRLFLIWQTCYMYMDGWAQPADDGFPLLAKSQGPMNGIYTYYGAHGRSF